LKLLDEKETAKVARQRELDAFKDRDPRVLERDGIYDLLRLLKLCPVQSLSLYKDAVERLTDNISNLRRYFTREMGVSLADFDAQFDLTEEFLDETL